MQLNRFDLNLLIALDALLHEKNVTRAAERVFLSQPAMSASLQKLRDFFQDQLLVRIGRDMELTPRARSLLQPVREALLKIQTTLGTQPTFDPATVRRTYTVIANRRGGPGTGAPGAGKAGARSPAGPVPYRTGVADQPDAAELWRCRSVPVLGHHAASMAWASSRTR